MVFETFGKKILIVCAKILCKMKYYYTIISFEFQWCKCRQINEN